MMWIGSGGFSDVFLKQTDNGVYACKRIEICADIKLKYLINQINAYRAISHPNIIKCYGFSMNNLTVFDILLQYVEGQTIDQPFKQIKFNKNKKNREDQELLFYWIYQISLALKYLKQKGIVHRDIKSSNILVNKNGIIKLIDFGIAKILYNQYSKLIGTQTHFAPQTIKSKQISHQSDIWALGITIYHLIHWCSPYKQKNLSREERYNYPIEIHLKQCSVEMATLLDLMLQKNPSERITAEGILNHPIIKSRERQFVRMYNQSLNADCSSEPE